MTFLIGLLAVMFFPIIISFGGGESEHDRLIRTRREKDRIKDAVKAALDERGDK